MDLVPTLSNPSTIPTNSPFLKKPVNSTDNQLFIMAGYNSYIALLQLCNYCWYSGHSEKLGLETKDGVQQFLFSSIENSSSYKHHSTSSTNNWKR